MKRLFTIATVSNDMNVRKPIIHGTTNDAFSLNKFIGKISWRVNDEIYIMSHENKHHKVSTDILRSKILIR